jgi:hypothetical protein
LKERMANVESHMDPGRLNRIFFKYFWLSNVTMLRRRGKRRVEMRSWPEALHPP